MAGIEQTDLDLAIAIARAKQTQINLSPTQPIRTEGLMPQLNRGIANVAGGPVDLVAGGMNMLRQEKTGGPLMAASCLDIY